MIIRRSAFRLLMIITAGLLVLSSCQRKKNDYAAEQLSLAEQDTFKFKIIRYIGHLPKRADWDTRFDARFDEAYRKLSTRMALDKYYIANDGYHYFLCSRIAPSGELKRVAIGGRLKYDENHNIVEYEEVFRTWKMEPKDLDKKSILLFDKMVKGEDLSPYYTMNSNGEEYIEFPDQNTCFDKEEHRWRIFEPSNN